MKNKIFAVILTVCMIITMIPIGVFGDEQAEQQSESSTTEEVPVFSRVSDLEAATNLTNLGFIEDSVVRGTTKSITGYLYIATKNKNTNTYISFRKVGEGEEPYITYSTSENNWPQASKLTYKKNENGSYTFTYNGEAENNIEKNRFNYTGYAISIKKNNAYVGNDSIYIEYKKNEEQSQGESEQPSADKTYEIRFDKLEDPADYKGDLKGKSDNRMWHLGQGTAAIFNTKITYQYTCFYVIDKDTNRDARGFANERVYIGSLSDFVIEAKEKSGSGNWESQSLLSENYQVFSMNYELQRKGFNNVFRITFALNKDDTNKATEKYDYRLRYTGDDRYLRNGNNNNLFVLNLERDEKMVEFDIDEARYDGVDEEGNKIFNEGNVQYFDKKGDYIDTKLVIRPGVMQSAADKKVYDSSYNIEIENEVGNIEFCRYDESVNQWVALAAKESPFTITWDTENKWYHIIYNPDKDFYGPEYAMRYVGDYDSKINGKYSYESGTRHTVENQSAFWTGKSTTYAESNTVNATLGDNVDKKRISTIGVIFRSGKVNGKAQIDITTDEGEITLGGSLSTNIGSISASGDVSFEMRDLLKDDYGLKDDQKKVIKGCEKAFDFKITSNNEKVEFGETGYAEIEIPCDRGMAIYYIDDKGNKTLESSTYEDDKIKFTAKHFSTYVVAPAENTGGSTIGGGTVVSPATDEVKTTTDGNITTTIKDVKTETVKNESGQEITKTTATVSADTANKLVNQAVSDKSEVIEVTVKSDSQTKVNGEKSTELEIPKSAVESIVKNTDASLVVKTDSGEVTLDNKTLETIAAEAEGDTVRIVVNENTQLKEEQKPAADAIGDNGKVFDIAAIIGGKYIHDFKGGKASVTLPMPEKLKGKDIVIVYINDKGICEILNHTMEPVGAEEYIKFTTSHFSTFAIVEKADAEKIIAQQNAEKVKTLIKEVSLKATTTKTSKKNVKVKVAEADKTDSLIKEIESMGYTVKYRFCRSAKASSSYVGKKTKAAASWINTKGTKGTKYYYKAKVYVYDGDELIAKTLLKQCSYSGRTWSK